MRKNNPIRSLQDNKTIHARVQSSTERRQMPSKQSNLLKKHMKGGESIAHLPKIIDKNYLTMTNNGVMTRDASRKSISGAYKADRLQGIDADKKRFFKPAQYKMRPDRSQIQFGDTDSIYERDSNGSTSKQRRNHRGS